MDCIGCTKTKPILNCIDSLVIGTLEPTTAYYVYFENSSNNKLNVIADVTTDADGLLSVDLGFTPNASVTYKVWVTLADATNIDARELIGINAIEADCLFVNFSRVYGVDNANITATSQTLDI